MKIVIGNTEIKHGLFLAPMAGFTDRAMRLICKSYGAEYLTSEMVSAKAICYRDKKTVELCRIEADEAPCALQLFGHEESVMAEATAMIYEGYAGEVLPCAIDINMGCPVPKITGNHEGSYLMKDPDLVVRLVSAVAKASPLPVTVKIRAGYDEKSINACEVAQAAQAGGASLICIHGRTKTQMYSGKADREIIARVKESVSVPVVANGDILSGEDAISMLRQTKCDGVAVARGAVGNPFIFAEIKALLEGRQVSPVTQREKIDTALLQLRLAIEDKGERIAVFESRKQIAEYIKGISGAAEIRAKINSLESYSEIKAILEEKVAALQNTNKDDM